MLSFKVGHADLPIIDRNFLLLDLKSKESCRILRKVFWNLMFNIGKNINKFSFWHFIWILEKKLSVIFLFVTKVPPPPPSTIPMFFQRMCEESFKREAFLHLGSVRPSKMYSSTLVYLGTFAWNCLMDLELFITIVPIIFFLLKTK